LPGSLFPKLTPEQLDDLSWDSDANDSDGFNTMRFIKKHHVAFFNKEPTDDDSV
jgi:hypothetical protein